MKKFYTKEKKSSIVNHSNNVGETNTVKDKTLFAGARDAVGKLGDKFRAASQSVGESVKDLEIKIVKKTKPEARARKALKSLNGLEKKFLASVKEGGTFIKPLMIASVALILFSASIDLLSTWSQGDEYDINARADSYILEEPEAFFGSYLEMSEESNSYKYNETYEAAAAGATYSAKPEFRAEFSRTPSDGYTITDAVNGISVSMKPNYAVKAPQQDENRLVYPLIGIEGTKVLTLTASQIKEDIIIDSYQVDELDFSYQLGLPDGVEARLENDGSLGIYGVESYLLGDNVQVGSEEDQKLLDTALENGEKTTLLFRIPAPFILEQQKSLSEATVEYSLEGDTLTMHVAELDKANYPISIDPSIYVETAQKLMRGNNETNTDFNVDNELIQKSQTTGARIDAWQGNLDMSDGVWDHSTAVAGGYVYRTGGRTGAASEVKPSIAGQTDSTQSSNSTNFTMSLPATRPAGDLYVAVLCHDGTGAVSPPAGGGWTEYSDDDEHAAYYKIGTDQGGGNESASYTWTGSNEQWGGTIMRITGFDDTDPVSGTPGTVNSSGVPAFPSVTPDEDTTLVVRSVGVDRDAPSATGWVPSAHTKVSSGVSSSPQGCGWAAASLDTPPTASTPTGTASLGEMNDTYGGASIAINPEPVAGGSTETVDTVDWAAFNSSTLAIESPNPGAGACTGWCTETAYDLPEARRGHSMIAYNGYLYVIGGLDSSGTRESTVYISKLGVNGEPSLWHPTDTNKTNWDYWYEDTGLNGGTARSYLSAVAYNNRMYVVGGQTNASAGGVTTVEMADILPNGKLGTWTTTGMQSLPSGAGTHMADVHVYNDIMYTMGGFEGVSTSSANLRNAGYYSKLNNDGTMNAWQATDSFTTARASFGGTFSYVWGAYIYLGGGCTAVNASGYCTNIDDDMYLASINADGSLDRWTDLGSLDNTRMGYSLIGWQGGLYRLGGCTVQDTTGGECTSTLSDVDYGVINPAGEVSTVSITESSGTSPCSGGSPQDCDLPPPGDDAGEGGQLLSVSVILNGYLYNIGGCIDYNCNGTSPAGDDSNVSGNVSYVAIAPDGSMEAPSTCSGTSYGAWCVDSTNRVNGTTGTAASGVTTFGGRIYVVGGLTGAGNHGNLYYNSVNTDGSLSGAWTAQTLSSVGISENIAYTYAYSRANPSSATNPGNLFVFGGCGVTSSAGCSNSDYETEVYKCNITSTGSVSGCTTSGQLQIDSTPGVGNTDGLGIHSGTVYANYIFLVGGYSQAEADKDDVIYAKIDDSNNIVAVSGSDWIESANKLSVGRRRGWAFGYNGHIYSVGGYDDSGTGIIPFIEWSKMYVSDGSIDPFVTSSVTINQRWGLSMAVSNSYAYVIGGCDVGASPNSCSSFEPSIQTFQLYNNDSGSVDDFTAQSDQTFTEETDRWGASSVIHDGHIYVAGGCVSATDCTETTDSVQYAPISAADGSVGTWAATSMNLPQNRGWGHLDEAGGTLYWVGGEDSAGDEKSDVYYSTPETAGAAEDVFRTTTYKINSTEFSGTTYTLDLNNDLEENYFAMISGAGSTAGSQGPDHGGVRVDGDPFGTLGTTTAADDILLSRGGSPDNWVGTVTVVECLTACGTKGFQLKETVDYSIAAGTSNAEQSVTIDLAEDHTTNTVPFGGYYGGGMESTDTANANYSTTLGIRIFKSATDDLTIERYGGNSQTPAAGDITIYVVEWGSEWNVEESQFDDWDAGGTNVTAAADYANDTISSVTRADTWVWKSPGTSTHNGLGSGAFGKVLTLGDGTSTQNATETTVSIGSQPTGSYTRQDTAYVMEHTGLATDYRFETVANKGTSFTATVDSAVGSETYATTGNIDSTEGYRLAMFPYSDNGTGTAFPRVAGFTSRHTATGTVTATKAYSGNNNGGWWQSADFNGITYTPTDGDLAKWETASNGLPADRTNFGATSWNDRLYVVGGLDDSAAATATVYVSPQQSSGGDITSAWTSSTAFDTARTGAAVTSYANNLYLFGGNDGTNYFSDTQFTQINADGTVDAWINSASMPNPLSDARAFSANGYIYLVGGRTAASTCTPKVLVVPISANTTIASGNNPTGVGEWYETNVRYTGDRYGVAAAYDEGMVYTMGGGCTAPQSSNRHYESTVNSQPQVAIYSRLIDTDTDVFPNAWLLNGLDNSIGARWQARYRTMNDTDGIATDCGTADMTTWGQETDFGDVTLGDVAPYTPKDSSGTDIDCARYFYFYISIDASKTFGYPEDVNRGPTIADLTLFFTSDPGKRLRHGKTFTGGEKQPLDTPCRQSEDADCPLP